MHRCEIRERKGGGVYPRLHTKRQVAVSSNSWEKCDKNLHFIINVKK